MRINRKLISGFLLAWMCSGLGVVLFGQAPKPVTATREIMAMTYPEGDSIAIKLQGTYRLPRVAGQADVRRKKGVTELEVKLDGMKAATLFGGDYNTYVLWVVSPEGQADNVGEVILDGKKGKLKVSTRLETFGIFVTAEPHYLVSAPSRFVVLENIHPKRNIGGLVKTSQIKYRGYEGVYNAQRETLANMPETRGEVRADVSAARTAVSLAERAGAERFAMSELAKAREALQNTEAAARAGTTTNALMTMGHEAVRLAVEAQKLAEERSSQAALDAERRAHARETAKLEKAAEEAKSDAEQAQATAERAKAEAARRAQLAAEEERLRREAEARERRTQQQAEQLAAAKSQAEMEAERARRENIEARMQLQEALSRVVQTRSTARGLILNLPDILFDTGKATLRPQAREVLSKVSGILLVAGGYRLSVEGHTDNVGSDELNQRLSEKRAESVRDYLVKSGLAPDIITTRGFGKSQPIASNATAAGRQENRRVEIVVEELKEFKFRP